MIGGSATEVVDQRIEGRQDEPTPGLLEGAVTRSPPVAVVPEGGAAVSPVRAVDKVPNLRDGTRRSATTLRGSVPLLVATCIPTAGGPSPAV